MASRSPAARVRLEPMTDAQCAYFLEAITPPYIAERAAADHTSPAAAETFVRQQHARVLPQGRLTEGHAFLSVVAAASSEAVGGLWLFLDRENHQAFLYNITVWPEFRRRGYGGGAIALAEEFARSAGCHTLGLNVFATNPGAQALYAKLGYAVVASHMNKHL